MKKWKQTTAAGVILLMGFLSACGDSPGQEMTHGEQIGQAEQVELGQQETAFLNPAELEAYAVPIADADNRRDLLHAEKLQAFCDAVDAGDSAEEILVVKQSETILTAYLLRTESGSVQITECHWIYRDGSWEEQTTESYPAATWKREGGYLFFARQRMSGYDGPSSHVAVRLEPLENDLRSLNETWILPIGYELNNLFLVDWDSEHTDALDLYDLYDRLYPVLYGTDSPYLFTNDLTENHETKIPAEEFESVLASRFALTTEQIRQNTEYHADTDSYTYIPRGYHGCEPADYPYPEVLEYREEADGTLILTVNAVYPNYDTADVLLHEVYLTKKSDGSYVYTGNRILRSRVEEIHIWRVERSGNQE